MTTTVTPLGRGFGLDGGRSQRRVTITPRNRETYEITAPGAGCGHPAVRCDACGHVICDRMVAVHTAGHQARPA